MATEDTRPSHRADRLRRAWALVKAGKVERLGGTRFRVAGNKEAFYYVDTAADPPCYCADQDFRGRKINQQCKHSLAGKLAALDEGLLGVVAEWLERETERELEASVKATNPKRTPRARTATT